MDRLIEQSPGIPDDILEKFKKQFDVGEVELTDAIKWNDMEKTEAHPLPREEQVEKVVSEATEAYKNPKLSQLKKMLAEKKSGDETSVVIPSA